MKKFVARDRHWLNHVLPLIGGCKKIVFAGLVASGVTASALAGSAAYQYDTLGRLTQVAYSNGVVINYTYDAAGNRTAHSVSGVAQAATMSRKTR